jgi:hypothetical protein
MKVVLTTTFDDANAAKESVQFHRAAGVDLVLAAVPDGVDLDRDGVQTVPLGVGRTELARRAAVEHGADWVISAEPTEFWWPRGESVKEVLAPIPERYTIVQGLRREFPPGDMTRRSTPEDGKGAVLRPVFRADPEVVVEADGSVLLRRNVPLRAWYPIEVMHLDAQSSHDEADLVEDTRLRDALQALHEGNGALTFRFPDIVEDARYAAECAAVGEVDLPKLERYVTELEQRVEWLEQRFWPRVRRRIVRIAGRTGR